MERHRRDGLLGAGTETCGRYDQSFNAFDFTTQFLQDADGCFTNLQYMAQLYINGTLTGSFTMQPQEDFITTALSPALAKDMNTGICVPSSWHRQPATTVTLPVYGTSERLSGPLSTEEMSYASPDGADGPASCACTHCAATTPVARKKSATWWSTPRSTR